MNKEEALKKIEELKSFVEKCDEKERDERLGWDIEVDEGSYYINTRLVCELYGKNDLLSDIEYARDLEICYLNPVYGYEFKIKQGFGGELVLALVKESSLKAGDKVKVLVPSFIDDEGIFWSFAEFETEFYTIVCNSDEPGCDWVLSNNGHISEDYIVKVG